MAKVVQLRKFSYFVLFYFSLSLSNGMLCDYLSIFSNIANENLRFLNVEQALADTAHFVEHIKLNSVTPGAQNSPVVVVGGHYSASLALWFRQSYPHLTIGTLNISAFIQLRNYTT